MNLVIYVFAQDQVLPTWEGVVVDQKSPQGHRQNGEKRFQKISNVKLSKLVKKLFATKITSLKNLIRCQCSFLRVFCLVEIKYSQVLVFTSSDKFSAPNTEESNKLKPGDFWEKFRREKKAGDFDVPSSQPKL